MQEVSRSPAATLDPDERRALVARIVDSAGFQKSQRHRELLLYLCTQGDQRPGRPVQELDIGVSIFGRAPDYDTGNDTIVRSHVSLLRKKLRHYFETEGAAEPLVLEIPKGSYQPVYTAREGGPLHGAAESRNLWKLAAMGLAVVSVGLAGLVMWLVSRPAGPPLSEAERVWQQMFANGRQTSMITADGSITIVQNILHRSLQLGEYQGQSIRSVLERGVKDERERALGQEILQGYFTSVSDVTIARRVAVMNARLNLPTDFVFARSFDSRQAASHNLILAGSRRSNPWLSLFEDRLNFQSVFEEDKRRAYFANRNPQRDEQPIYEVIWDRKGFCRVAYIPGLDAATSALILSGTDMGSSEAGILFLTADDGIARLREALKVGREAPLPHFEALLATELVASSVPRATLVAYRKH